MDRWVDGWLDDAVVQVRRECEWEELNTDVHAIDDYTMLHDATQKHNPPIVAPLAGLWGWQGSSTWTGHTLGQVLAERHIPHSIADEQREEIPLFLAAG